MSENLNWRDLERFPFGDSPATADELAGLVLAGRKRATSKRTSNENHFGPKLVLAVSERDRIRGPANAAVTLVEYCDYQCPY